jgi:rod shape-determining protein MreC
MRNILALIQRFYVFLMFLALQILALVILFNSNNYHRSEILKQSNGMVGYIYSNRAKLSEYLRLGEINDRLSLENALLRSELPDNYMLIRHDVDSLRDTTTLQRYTYRIAKVINATLNRKKNYVVLDRGYDGGISEGMGVISNGAIVGAVRSVSEHFSIVMPVLHTDFKASVKLKRSGVIGSMVWGKTGFDPAIADVIDVPKNIPVAPGDTIITSGFSEIFPANLIAGIVEEVNDEDNDYHIIRVRLGADFRRLDHVMVIGDLFKEEQENLIQGVEQQDAANDHR